MGIHRPASQLLLSTASRSIRYSHKQSRHSVRYASTALPSSSVPLDEKLVRLARQTLSKAAAEFNNSNNANGESNSHNDAETAKKKKHIETLREALKEWQATTDLRQSLEDVIYDDEDPDMRELAMQDYEATESQLSEAISKLQSTLLPSDPTTALGCLMEIKSGVGGSEASIFAADLMRMYSRFASSKKWKSEIVSASSVSASTSTAGGSDAFREVILEIDGEGAFGMLRHEAGVHRVQRVPATESQGRVHTSTAAVVVLPSLSEHDQTAEKLYDEKDIKVEVMRSGGAGGQHVNRTESAVRLTHIPTGISVSIQETRSQHKNRAKAYQVLRGRLLALQLEKQQASDRAARRAQVRGTDRSEKIRTYNAAQDRVTDHRLPLTMNGVMGFLDGDDGSLEIMAGELNKWTERTKIDDMLESDA